MDNHINRQGVRAICVRLAYDDFWQAVERYRDEAQAHMSPVEGRLYDRLLCQADALEAAVAEIEILAGQKEKKGCADD